VESGALVNTYSENALTAKSETLAQLDFLYSFWWLDGKPTPSTGVTC
jgi:hypothetical protein